MNAVSGARKIGPLANGVWDLPEPFWEQPCLVHFPSLVGVWRKTCQEALPTEELSIRV